MFHLDQFFVSFLYLIQEVLIKTLLYLLEVAVPFPANGRNDTQQTWHYVRGTEMSQYGYAETQ